MELGVPFSAAYIVNSAPEEFLLLQRRFLLNRQQLALCKDIRRRGKNKVSTYYAVFWLGSGASSVAELLDFGLAKNYNVFKSTYISLPVLIIAQ